MAAKSVVLKTFLANLDELETTAELLSFVWDMAAGIEPTWINKNRFFNLVKSVDKARALEGLFLIGHAAFEDFHRKLYVETVSRLSDASLSYQTMQSKYPNVIRNNLYCSGRALATVRAPISYMRLKFDDIAVTLQSSVAAAKLPVVLNSAAFAFDAPRPILGEIADSYCKLSIEIKKEDLVDTEDIRKLLGTKGKHETANAADVQLEEWVDLRNRLAHSQGEVREVDMPTIKKQHQLSRALATRIQEVTAV